MIRIPANMLQNVTAVVGKHGEQPIVDFAGSCYCSCSECGGKKLSKAFIISFQKKQAAGGRCCCRRN